MAKNVLPVDFQDDILSEDMDGRRKYQMITNADGTVSFVDVTEYTQVGSNFGQAQINATNEAVNESADKNKIIDTKADLMANTQAGMIAGASAVKAAVSELTENSTYTPLTLLGTVDGIKLYYSRYGKNVMIKGEGKFSKEETIAPSAGLVLTTLPKDIRPSTTLFYSLNYLYTNASTLTLSILANGEVTICTTGGSISIASGKYFNFTVEFIL